MTYTDITKMEVVIRGTVRVFTIAQNSRDKLFYIFDQSGGKNMEQCFSSLDRAKAYVPTIDHMVRFSSTVRKMPK